MKMMKRSALSGILAFFAMISFAFAQEIECNVSVDLEQIAPENRVNVSTMENDVKNYINNQRFTDLNWEGKKIPVDINIYITGGSRNRYSAKLFIVSKRYIAGGEGTSVTLKLIDNDWSFDYAQNATLSYNPSRFNEFSSMLDFYMLTIIGYDMDTYGELDGTACYEKAKQVCQLGASAGVSGYQAYSDPGKLTRYSIVSELTDFRYEDFRKLIFSYFVDGLDQMDTKRDEAIKQLAGVIYDMSEFKKNKMVGQSVLVQAFFDAKSMEICSIFKGIKDYPDIFGQLMYLDPMKSSDYQAARDAK